MNALPSILLVTRHYPPLVSGGCRRSMLMVRALREAGALVCVVAPVVGDDEFTTGIAVQHPQPEPDLESAKAKFLSLTKLKNFLRTWLLYPDADVRWCRRAAKAAIQHWPDGFDWVITSSPPESAHVAGRMLQKQWRCLWLADIRDFWFEYPLAPVRHNPLRKILEKPLAQSLLRQADIVTAVSKLMACEAEKISGRSVSVVKNFIDSPPERDAKFFQRLTGAPIAEDSVNVVYTGAFSLSDPNRHLAPVLEVFQSAVAENPKLVFHIAGPVTAIEKSLIEDGPHEGRIIYHGKVDAATARHFQVNADALILTAADGTNVVPGKLVEYRAAGVPIIAIGNGPWRQGIGIEREALHQLTELTRQTMKLETDECFKPEQAAQQILQLMADFSFKSES